MEILNYITPRLQPTTHNQTFVVKINARPPSRHQSTSSLSPGVAATVLATPSPSQARRSLPLLLLLLLLSSISLPHTYISCQDIIAPGIHLVDLLEVKTLERLAKGGRRRDRIENGGLRGAVGEGASLAPGCGGSIGTTGSNWTRATGRRASTYTTATWIEHLEHWVT